MKFKFSLETLMNHRGRLRDFAKRDFLLAQKAVDESMEKINNYYKSIDRTRERMTVVHNTGGSIKFNGLNSEEFINGVLIKIEEEKKNVRHLMQLSEEKRALLVEAMREHKSLVVLKEKKHAEFLKDMKKKEASEIDDIVMSKHKGEL